MTGKPEFMTTAIRWSSSRTLFSKNSFWL